VKIERTKLALALAFGLFIWSLIVSAQQPINVPRIGILSDETPSQVESFDSFAQGLRDLGYTEGENIAFERRYASEDYKTLPSLAVKLVGLRPDVILAIGTPAATAAKAATQTIPIVFARISDPVGAGLASSLAHPGGNLTGVSILTRETAAKRLELLVRAVPKARRVGVLWHPDFPPAGPQFKEVEEAARSLDLHLVPVGVRGPDDFERALGTMREQGVDALIVVNSPMFSENLHRLPGLLVKARLPSLFPTKKEVEAGGLMSYATDYSDMYRRAAAYVDKILKGAKPAHLPVEQPTKFELVINLKTAKVLGLTIPPLVLARADEVIE
jgi:putative ABC transport system substrate-binding protein